MTGTTRVLAAEITGLKGAAISFVAEGGRITRIYAVVGAVVLGLVTGVLVGAFHRVHQHRETRDGGVTRRTGMNRVAVGTCIA